jgi:putative peptide zinc metalloprotease protein
MSETLFSSYWYRVADLRPRLRGHAGLHRQEVRGEPWYVLQDTSTGRNLRLSPAGWWICGLMDGTRSVQEIWDATTRRLGDDAPTQDETIQLLARLHASDILQCDVPPDSLELFNRFEREERSRRWKRFANPLSLRFPLLDPERLLARGLPAVRPLFGRAGFVAWLAVVTTALVLATSHWRELTFELADRVLAPENLLLLAFVYPLVKTLHECGHAFATKVWGGEVHEAGIVLLVLMPIPYVDASASTAFRSRRRRIVVAAAGMMVELFLAGLALFVWLLVEPGLVRDAAWNVMLIGSVSTLLFNGNPLLRFDGYYVLADALDIPNLGQRSNRWLAWWVEHHLFDLRETESRPSSIA